MSKSNQTNVPQRPTSTPPLRPSKEQAVQKRSPHFLANQEMVRVDVSLGGEKKSFIIHKTLICHYSPFLNAALHGEFIENETQRIEFPDTGPGTFELLIGWTYTQKITFPDGSGPTLESYIYLWILADKLLIPALQNSVIKLLHDDRMEFVCPRPELIRHVYRTTTQKSPLRVYVAEIYFNCDHDQISSASRYPKEFLVDVIKVLRRRHWNKSKRMPTQILERFYVSEVASQKK